MNAISMQRFLERLENENLEIIDIRDKFQYQQGKIKNAKNIPLNYLLMNPSNYLNKEKIYYLYCQSGFKSKKTTDILNDLGYHTINIVGGYNQYVKNI